MLSSCLFCYKQMYSEFPKYGYSVKGEVDRAKIARYILFLPAFFNGNPQNFHYLPISTS